jgi:hypothetical protein
MGNNNQTIAQTGFSRVFLIAGRARPDHKPAYQSIGRALSPEQNFGDVTPIKAPDPNEYNKFIEVGSTKAAVERPTITVENRYLANIASEILRLARLGCEVDVQIHFGVCTDPSIFNTFTKDVVLEGAIFTKYSAEDLGALSDDQQVPVNESGDLSAKILYEIMPITVTEQAGSIITNQVLDVVICDTPSCGTCTDESGGSDKIFAVTKSAGGSVSTPPDIIYSLNKGVTWAARDIDQFSATQDANAVACLNDYVVAFSQSANALAYVLKSDFKLGVLTWTKVTTGFVAGKGPNDAFNANSKIFVAGQGGYVYETEDPTAGVTVLEAGNITVDNLLAIHAYDDFLVVAVGTNGAIIYSVDGVHFAAATRPVGLLVDLNAVCVVSRYVWFVGTSTGVLYYTLDGGVTWTVKDFAGSASGSIQDITFVNQTTGFFSHKTATTRARLFRTYDGGYSWKQMQEATATIPLCDELTALAVSSYDENFVIAGGIADNSTDGILLLGTD